ncbi:siderophore-interacting protein [Agrobacterium sp. MOPV5]|nr:siderophore-interacting protein [Agrobacterium leguminum]
MLEYLPATAAGHAFIEVDTCADELPLSCSSSVWIQWSYHNGKAAGTTTLLQDAIRAIRWPERPTNVFFWGGCEHKAFSAIHRHLTKDAGLPRDRFVLYSHWHWTLSEEDIIAKGPMPIYLSKNNEF